MPNQIIVRVSEEGIFDVKNIPDGFELVVLDTVSGDVGVYGKGDNNFLSQFLYHEDFFTQ